MSLDISFSQLKKQICPHCGEEIATDTVDCECSGGRAWYPFLESIGYYVPYDQRTDENDWYAKDMTLTSEQLQYAYGFVKESEVYNRQMILLLLGSALFEGNSVVVNADW